MPTHPASQLADFRLFLFTLAMLCLPLSAQAVKQGDDALDFTLPLISAAAGQANQEISLSDFKGRVVYLDFWATWCSPCRQTFPWMDEMHARYEKDGLSIIAVGIDQKREIVEKFVQQMEPSFMVLQDRRDDDARLTYRRYRIPGMPTSYLIDRDGRIALRHVGFRAGDKKELEEAIQDLLDQ